MVLLSWHPILTMPPSESSTPNRAISGSMMCIDVRDLAMNVERHVSVDRDDPPMSKFKEAARHVNHSEAKPDFNTKRWISSCRDRALLVSGSNTAEHATLVALLDPSTHFRPPLTHTSHHRPALVDLRRFSGVSGVSLRAFQPFQAFL